MAARTQNTILKSLLQRETDAGLFASPHFSCGAADKSRQNDDVWCVIATDGSKRVISCKPALNEANPNAHPASAGEDHANETVASGKSSSDQPEPGIDLSYLNVENKPVSKLIAGMQAVTENSAATSSHSEIKMPSAKTDLKELFKTDNVCIVNPPTTTASESREKKGGAT
jgi:hypothetical protein